VINSNETVVAYFKVLSCGSLGGAEEKEGKSHNRWPPSRNSNLGPLVYSTATVGSSNSSEVAHYLICHSFVNVRVQRFSFL
jgi:hypothetical protein